MTYDDWKTESPEDEDERLNGPARRRQARYEWEEEHADGINELHQEQRRLEKEDRD
jgi:hypothetical protein